MNRAVDEQPERRSQESRSEETRGLAIAAAVQLLVSGGFPAATTPAIALKAGISRGRLTHQFPTKEALLVAVVEHLTDLFVAGFTVEPQRRAGMARRVERIVRQAARVYLSDDYLALLHVFFGAASEPDLARELARRADRVALELPRVWRSAFDDLELDASRLALAFRIVVDMLRGMAINRMLGRDNPLQEQQIRQIVRCACGVIAGRGALEGGA